MKKEGYCLAWTFCAMLVSGCYRVSDIGDGETVCEEGASQCHENTVELCADEEWYAHDDCGVLGLTCVPFEGEARCIDVNGTASDTDTDGNSDSDADTDPDRDSDSRADPFEDWDCGGDDADDPEKCDYTVCANEDAYDSVVETCDEADAEYEDFCDSVMACYVDYVNCFSDACRPGDDVADADDEEVDICVEDYTDCTTDAAAEL